MRWVRDFLLSAREHGGYAFEQTLDLFLAEVGDRIGTNRFCGILGGTSEEGFADRGDVGHIGRAEELWTRNQGNADRG